MYTLLLRASAAALVLAAAPCAAQTANTIQFPAGWAPGIAPCTRQADGSCVPVSAAAPLPTDTVVRATSTDRGAVITTSGAAQQLMAANSARRGFSLQNQSSGACFVSGTGTATADYHSLQIAAGAYYETPDTHVGTGAVSVICTVANASIYAREW